MACLSSPLKWAAPRHPRHPQLGLGRGQPFCHRRHETPLPYEASQQQTVTSSTSQPYVEAQRHFAVQNTPVVKTRALLPVTNESYAPATNLSDSFAPIKSPMSQCIDTIIGAAEVVNRSEAWIDRRRTFEEDRKSSSKKKKKANTEAENTSIMEEVDEIEAELEDPDFYRTLTLTMALERPRKSDKPGKLPPNLIGEGFYWKEYPELEDVLYMEMSKYYEYSANSRQSKHQQAYNNLLVETVKESAAEYGYEFDPQIYNDKKLRDRIRCFYKTHLQNAKKRLQTLQKHIVGPDQRRSLQTLIEKAKTQPPPVVAISYDDGSDGDEEEEEQQPPTRRRRGRTISVDEAPPARRRRRSISE